MANIVLEVKENFIDLERHRLRLEENVAKLRESLQHWQTWEAEYEGMKEEIEGLSDRHTDTELAHAANESVGALLNDKEVKLLLEDDKGQCRNSSQIIGLLSRRIEYVQQNIKTMTSLLDTAEGKLAASAVISQPGVHNEEGLPLTEIREELDEEGNVISSSTNAPGTAAPHVVEALRKAGISGPPDTPEHVSQSDIESVDQENQTWVTEDTSHTPATSILKSPKMQGAGVSSPVSGGSSRKSTESKSSSRRKSVTFAEGTKLTDAVTSKPNLPNSPRALKTINEIKRQAGLTKLPTKSIKPNKPSNRKLKRLLEADGAGDTGQADFGQATKQNANDVHHDALENPKEDSGTAVATNEAFIETTIGHPTKDSSSSEAATAKNAQYIEAEVQEVDLAPPIMSADESPEDAALRRQMLAYSMNEVGAVVAEIELDEEEEDPSDASNTDDEDGANSDASSLEEEEDEHGRTKRRVLNDATLEEMRALEERLNATAIQNVGPHGNGLTAPVMERSSGNIIHDSSSKDLSYPLSKTSIPKEVRFAEELDLQDMPVKNRGDGVVNPFSKPVKDNIIERVAPVGGLTEPNAAPKTVSRFKSTRAGNTTIFSNRAGHDILTADARGEKLFPKKCASPKSTSNQHHLTGHIALTSSQSPRQVPTGPPNRTHAPTVIERPYSAIADSSMAVEPDELDPALLHQQVATEYHRMRNRIVQRQGGFLASDVEKECVPLTEEEGGAPKISRFKAARLARM